MRVATRCGLHIPEGCLEGFVGINRTWRGMGLGGRILASAKALLTSFLRSGDTGDTVTACDMLMALESLE